MKKLREVFASYGWSLVIIAGVLGLSIALGALSPTSVAAAPTLPPPPPPEHVKTFTAGSYVDGNLAGGQLNANAAAVDTQVNSWLTAKGDRVTIRDRKVQVAVAGGPAVAWGNAVGHLRIDSVFVSYTVTIFYAE